MQVVVEFPWLTGGWGDTTPPVVTIDSQDRVKISGQGGVNATNLTFTVNEDHSGYQVRLVSSESATINQGTLVESGGAGTAGVQRAITITDAELIAAGGVEGSNLLKIFVIDMAGNPSQQVAPTPPAPIEQQRAEAVPKPAPPRPPRRFKPPPKRASKVLAEPQTVIEAPEPAQPRTSTEVPVVMRLGYGRVGIDYLGPDFTPPTVSVTISRSRISRQAGADLIDVNVTTSEPVLEYQIRVVPNGTATINQGTLVESGVVSPDVGVTSFSAQLTDDELVAAGALEGDNVVKVFVLDPGGNWSSA